MRLGRLFVVAAYVAALSAAGCCPCRKAVSSQVADSISSQYRRDYREIVRRMTVPVRLPDESRHVLVRQDSSSLETSLAFSHARIDSTGRLHHTLRNKAVEIPVEVQVREVAVRDTVVMERVRTEKIEVPARLPLRWWEKALMWAGVAGMVILVVRLAVTRRLF